MLNRGSKDIFITSNGDIAFDLEKGDLKVADSRGLEIFRQAAIRRLMSSKGDFRTAPEIGANLKDFTGFRNTSETGSLIKSAILNSLVVDNLFASAGLDIKVFPLNESNVGVMVMGRVSALEGDGFVISASYDLRDNKIIPRRL